MQLINVVDEDYKDTLLSHGYNLLQIIEDIHDKKIWVFEYSPSLFSLDINDENVKGKVFFTSSSKMTFAERR
jgi:hypothetical protein